MNKFSTYKYELEKWNIATLIKRYKNNQINLQPHYQRNDIWSSRTQRELIDTISKGLPLPSFFVRMVNNHYEMVDGQQRSRAIIGFLDGSVCDLDRLKYKDLTKEQIDNFNRYSIHVVLLNGLSDKEAEDFYVLVNSAGVKLNRPELRKAEYYNTLFLKLCENLASEPDFEKLNIFTDKSAERMNDIDLISELIACLKYGPSDKKEKVDLLFESDINQDEYNSLQNEALRIFNEILKMCNKYPLSATRLKQKGDFYTLFYFLHNHKEMPDSQLEYMYDFIIKSMPHIRPSQEECETFREYALACVSQANSKDARLKRNKFFEDLFCNTTDKINESQDDVIKYFSKVDNRKYELTKNKNYIVIKL
jgi:hypothetical protein